MNASRLSSQANSRLLLLLSNIRIYNRPLSCWGAVGLVFIAERQLSLPGLKTLSLTFWTDILGASDTELGLHWVSDAGESHLSWSRLAGPGVLLCRG